MIKRVDDEMMINTGSIIRVKYKRLRTFFVLASCIVMTACASKTTKEEEFSGFLSDYSQLEKSVSIDETPVRKWISPELKEHNYTKIMLDPVVIYPAPQPTPQLSSEVITSIRTYLNQELRHEIGKNYEIVDEPAEDVIRLRTAITGVKTTPEDLAVYEYIPVGLVLAGVSTATGSRDEMVQIYVEAELSDSLSGEKLAAGVKKGFGETIEGSDDQVELDNAIPVLNGWVQSSLGFLNTTVK